jgi:hypothetical protein
MRVAILGCLVVALLALAACENRSPSFPSESSSLKLTANISSAVLQSGDVATLTFRLKNAAGDTRTLQFSSGCQLLPFIATTSSSVVYPGGGSWMCTQALTSLTLAPGQVKEETVRISRAPSGLDSVYGLPAGDYVAYARVDSSSVALRSENVAFTVK